MLEEPTSRPTMDFDPNPNMCPPFCVARATSPATLMYRGRLALRLSLLRSRSFRRNLRLALGLRLHLARLLFHPLVQLRFLEAPAIAQLERGNLLFANVFVQSVRTYAQILRRLANIHHFSRVGHSSFTFSTEPARSAFCRRGLPWGRLPALSIGIEGFRCPEHISALKNQGTRRISAFCRVFYLFCGMWTKTEQEYLLYLVDVYQHSTIRWISCAGRDSLCLHR